MNKFGTSIQTATKRQPGATFTVQRYGFDTGTRTYRFDSSRSLTGLLQVGKADQTYPRMYITSVQVTKGVAEITTATVSYEGLINKTKEDYFEVGTSVEILNDVPTVTGQSIANGVRWHRALPTVTHVYVTSKYPDPLDVGAAKEPPKYGGNVAEFYANKWRPGFYTIFNGWMLKTRSIRESGPLYAVTDVYGYTINEVKTS